MKIIIFVFIVFVTNSLILNAQNFRIDTMRASKFLRIIPTFDTLKLGNRKPELVYFDNNYIKDFANNIITESLSPAQIKKLKESFLTIKVYIGNDGKGFYAYFLMHKDLREVIKDSDFRAIYENTKFFTFRMDKAEKDSQYSGDFMTYMIELKPW